jgi:hypothetical protein
MRVLIDTERGRRVLFNYPARRIDLGNLRDVIFLQADASVDMAERHFFTASMEYVYLIQEVHERKKFEFVEALLTFLFGWLTFYHQGHEVAADFNPYRKDLQEKIQRTRANFDDYSNKLRKRMAEVQHLEKPVRKSKGCREGYLFLLEKKAFGTTWTKHFCKYDKETKEFSMLPYNQLTSKTVSQPETMVLTSCVRRMSDSIDKRFCFDIQLDAKPGVAFTLQALSEQDRKAWMDIMDGKEPTYTAPGINKAQNSEERVLDDVGIQFVKKCIEVLENRGLEEQGMYRVVGVTSKVNKLLNMGLDRRKSDKLSSLDDPQEWETKTITSALKSYLRNLPEPLMTYKYHNGFIAAVKNETRQLRIHDVHTLVHRLPKTNFEVLKLLLKHLANVAAKSEKNLMTVSNLGVCFGPTLLRPEEETVASIMDLKFYNIVVEILIENYDKIFNSEPDKTLPSENTSPRNQPPGINYKHAGDHQVANYAPEGVDLYRNYNSNHSNHVGQPYMRPHMTCTVKAYYEEPVPANMCSSLYSVHESANGAYPHAMTRSEHLGPNFQQKIPQKSMQRFIPTVSSQSESNIPNLPSHSPTYFRPFNRISKQFAFLRYGQRGSNLLTPEGVRVKTNRTLVFTRSILGTKEWTRPPACRSLFIRANSLTNCSGGFGFTR